MFELLLMIGISCIVATGMTLNRLYEGTKRNKTKTFIAFFISGVVGVSSLVGSTTALFGVHIFGTYIATVCATALFIIAAADVEQKSFLVRHRRRMEKIRNRRQNQSA